MIHHQSVFETWPIEDSSVQAIITSPPYWSLRKYAIPDVVIGGEEGCAHEWGNGKDIISRVAGIREPEHKSERDKLMDGERVSSGSSCIRCSAWKGQYGLEHTYQKYIEHTLLWAREAWRVMRDDGVMFINLGDSYGGGKGKLLIPHRVAIALIDDGWILRNDIIWFKPNAMPESVSDRFSKKFEYIFMFVKRPKYYFDLDGVREKNKDISINRIKSGWKSNHPSIGTIDVEQMGERFCNPKGKKPGDLWTFNTQPSPEKHYAMWPEKLVERMVLCSTKPGDIVCDPFAGSGTTLRVSDQHNRTGIGIDLGYKDIQKRRLSNVQKKLL